MHGSYGKGDQALVLSVQSQSFPCNSPFVVRKQFVPLGMRALFQEKVRNGIRDIWFLYQSSNCVYSVTLFV